MKNPLLANSEFPQFKLIKPAHIKPAVTTIINKNKQELAKLLERGYGYTWENLITPLDDLQEKLTWVWNTAHHLNQVQNSPQMRKAFESCLPIVSNYYTELAQNKRLYLAIKEIAKSQQYKKLLPVQQKIIRDHLRDFRLSGIDLPQDKQAKFKDLTQKLAKLGNKFSNNVLDATNAWTITLSAAELSGIPEQARMAAKNTAEKLHKSGWVFTLQFPSYIAIMQYADSRRIRRETYTAYITRASKCGPNPNKWDNSKIITEILKLRKQLAQLIGFNNYTEFSLATKMAKQPKQVLDFLNQLAHYSLTHAKHEFAELRAFAKKNYAIKKLYPWDLAYFSEKLREQKFAISEEKLRAYFPLPQVLTGLFEIAKRLYGITVKEKINHNVWDPQVKFFAIYDQKSKLRGQLYLDLYARTNKRSGAWADACRSRRRLKNGATATPLCYLVCNFNSPLAKQPALLTHNDVTTLFHEFGHCLHHLLSTQDYLDASGFHGVPWDAVELPSQFMENWCWQHPALKLLTKHYQTGKALPEKILRNLLLAKNFQAAMQMLRQLEFGLFDFRLHLEFNPKKPKQLQKILNTVRKKISVIPIASFNRSQNSFLHIFAGEYAAGYYSYKWAEVLAADAFSKFVENGIFDRKTGREFLHTILEAGGSAEPMELFIKFRGRKPKIDALLKQCGITAIPAKHQRS
ncbi:MAG: M3 family metallopeptidase [Gammaproteobacteria bacterium]|nr:M3 family metallopeptidase [Gammaproteobacteria bacterium]